MSTCGRQAVSRVCSRMAGDSYINILIYIKFMKQKTFLGLAILGLFFISGCIQQSTEIEKNISIPNTTTPERVAPPLPITPTLGEVAPAPILDNGYIEATILSIYHPKPGIDNGKIRVDKIIEYNHHPAAKYAGLNEGDEIDIYFQWGAGATIVDAPPMGNLSGVTIGNKIRVKFGGCPMGNGCGNGWTLYEYSLI